MKNKANKTAKLIYKAEVIKNEAFSESNPKKYLKKITAAEKLCGKALDFSRADISEGINDGFNSLICSIYSLASLLCRTNRRDEAEPLLIEARSLDGFEGHMYSIAINSYYGSILAERGEYDTAAEIFNKIMEDAVINKYGAFIDAYALCEAYGNAACAFTYADTETGYPSERFTEPLVRLLEIKKLGFVVRNESLKKASYFAASHGLFHMCFEALTQSDSENTVKTASMCVEFCKESEKKDFYLPAAVRIIAFAAARDLRFEDCEKICLRLLDICSEYTEDTGRSPYGSVQDIAADVNILLGIMHYRVNNFEISVKYFDSAIALLYADAKGKALNSIGYVETETIIMSMTSAEKAAFAYKYKGLAMRGLDEKYNISDCIAAVKKGAELISSVSDEPYFYLKVSSEYQILSDLCNEAGDLQSASEFSDLSRKYNNLALDDLDKCQSDRRLYDKYLEYADVHKRLALRHGLLEQYGYSLQYELMLCQKPYAQTNRCIPIELNYDMGELCRILRRYEAAVEYYDNVRTLSFDESGNMHDELKAYVYTGNAVFFKTAILVNMGNMAAARESFKEFIKINTITSGGKLSLETYIDIANKSFDIKLNFSESAEYFHTAAVMSVEKGDDSLRTAQLFNREGICWYHASPEKDDPNADCNCDECQSRCEKFEPMSERYSFLKAKFASRELAAFENAYRELSKCDQKDFNAAELMPSLLSNIGECYVRCNNLRDGLNYYQKSADAFELLFAIPEFIAKNNGEKFECVMQYGMCFKAMYAIYQQINDDKNACKAITKAISVFEEIDTDEARDQLSFCLNARGCINYRMGNYKEEVNDLTRAVKLQSSLKDNEIPMAIVLKNRSEAHEALGDYKSMQDDLTKAIYMLDNSDMPKAMLNQMYGDNWYLLAICQEKMNNLGRAADSYLKASKYFSAIESPDNKFVNTINEGMCHFYRANCLCQRDEREYYGALSEYNNAVKLLEELPSSAEKNERLAAILSLRGRLYELICEIDLANADYRRVEQLKNDLSKSLFDFLEN